MTSTGIPALNDRLGGGFGKGGVYIAAGPPGPAKLAAALQFLCDGVSRGERGLLLTGTPAADILDVASTWGMDLRAATASGLLSIVGFREDFEMRVLRSADPQDVLEELALLATPGIDRVAVDPGALLVQGGARTLLGRAFIEWARRHPATFLVTLSIDGLELPSSAEWVIQGTSGVLLIDQGEGGLHTVDLRHLFAESGPAREVTLQLQAGRGLVTPEAGLSRRRSDRPAGHPDRLLFLSMCQEAANDLERWARGVFTTEVVREPIEAVSSLQTPPGFGCILIYVSRERVADAVRTCRALRPLTRASLVVVSDDAIRSSDRVDLLEAGADDSLSGGVDVRELGARIRQAVENGGKPAPIRERKERERPVGGLVEGSVFEAEVRARLDDPWRSVLTVVRVSQRPEGSKRLRDFLVEEIRAEQGDMLAVADGAILVLLQGARRDAAGIFVDRVRRRVAAQNGATPIRSEVFSHPGDRQGILGLMPLPGGWTAPMWPVARGEAHGTED